MATYPIAVSLTETETNVLDCALDAYVESFRPGSNRKEAASEARNIREKIASAERRQTRAKRPAVYPATRERRACIASLQKVALLAIRANEVTTLDRTGTIAGMPAREFSALRNALEDINGMAVGYCAATLAGKDDDE